MIGWIFLFLFKPISRNWIETFMNGAPCTFRSTLYLRMYFVLSLLKVQSTWEGTSLRRNQYIFHGEYEKGTTYIRKCIYVLSDVRCTFDCTLYFPMYVKEYKMYVRQCRKTRFNFLKKSNTLIMHMQFFVWVQVFVPKYVLSLKSKAEGKHFHHWYPWLHIDDMMVGISSLLVNHQSVIDLNRFMWLFWSRNDSHIMFQLVKMQIELLIGKK